MDNILTNEYYRLRALCTLGILDTPAEERFDQFTVLASAAFGVPIALVSLVDRDRQWFKSRQGLAVGETHRSLAFCSHAIESDETLIVADALQDPRFADNPLVLDAPHIRFYAGHPIRTHDGFAAGTLCIIDTKPRSLNDSQLSMLRSLAKLVEHELNRDAVVRARNDAENALHALNASLDQRVRERTLALQEKNDALSREIGQRAAAEASLRSSEERVRTIIETSFSAFVAADADGCIIEWNNSAERVFGWSRAEVLGLSLSSTIIPAQFRAAHETEMARFGQAGFGGELNKTLQLPAKTKSGAEIAVEMTISTFTLDGMPYFSAFLNDVSAPLHARRALEQKQELLDAVLETVDVGVIACGADGDLTVFNRTARAIHGQQPGQVDAGQCAECCDLFEADGTTRMAPSEMPLLRALAGETVKDVRIVVAPPGMKRRTLLASGRLLLSPSGERLGAVVALSDITELIESKDKLKSSEQMLRTITDNVPVLISYLDIGFRFQFANAIYKEWLGQRSADMIGNTVEEVFGAGYFDERKVGLTQALAGHMTNIEAKVHRKGHERILSSTYIPHHRDGQVVGIYVLSTDATAAREHERQLLALANADPLTNLPNRRMYEFHLEQALALARRQGTQLALMYLDLDNFKKINDTFGHSAGDAILIEFGARVKSVLRESDMLARLAGDEFTVVLEGVGNIANCEAVASKILEVLKKPFSVCGQLLQISASIGVALGGADATADSLAHEADAALYSSKRKGKSRFCVIALAAKTARRREAHTG